MATYNVDISAYYEVEADSADEAWEMVNKAISGVFYDVRKDNDFIDGEIEIGEVEEN
jgi:hypothetical protein